VQIKRLKISNFRSIQHADIEFGPITVLIGTNNAGKSAILEAIRIALTRRWGQRGTGFTEYDATCATPDPIPRSAIRSSSRSNFRKRLPMSGPRILTANWKISSSLTPCPAGPPSSCVLLAHGMQRKRVSFRDGSS
jgi:hypothetical protein